MSANNFRRWVGRAVALTLVSLGVSLAASAPAHADFQWRQVGVHGGQASDSPRTFDFQW